MHTPTISRHRVLDCCFLLVAACFSSHQKTLAQNDFAQRDSAQTVVAQRDSTKNVVVQSDDLPRLLPAAPIFIVRDDARIAPLKAKIRRAQIFDAYRKLAAIYIELGRYDDAARTRREEAAQYRRKGAIDAAIIKEQRAAQLETDVRLFIDSKAPTTKSSTRLARLEPQNGCYLGAFIDRDDALGERFFDENWQSHSKIEKWTQLVGKPHASYFMYLKYGQKFPRRWVEHLKANGAIPHIAWEPSDLNAVRDDEYLRDFARQMARCNWPVFVRFACEMNGSWTPYHGNPALYREKFRLVHRVLHEEAPLCATIWCVGNPPLKNIAAYYPGDDGCDWVGVNFYSVPFHENKANRPAFDENPLALLDPIYKSFAARKPIAICEYAASHRAALDRVSRPDFAREKLALLYGALPRLYPRVKLVDWFSMNSMRYPAPGKTLNDYSLGGNNRVLDTYRQAISEPFFLSRWAQNAAAQNAVTVPQPLHAGEILRDRVVLSIWAKTYVARPKVYLQVGRKIVYASNSFGAHQIALDLREFPKGRQTVTAFVFDERNRFVRQIATSVVIS